MLWKIFPWRFWKTQHPSSHGFCLPEASSGSFTKPLVTKASINKVRLKARRKWDFLNKHPAGCLVAWYESRFFPETKRRMLVVGVWISEEIFDWRWMIGNPWDGNSWSNENGSDDGTPSHLETRKYQSMNIETQIGGTHVYIDGKGRGAEFTKNKNDHGDQ